MKLFYHTSTSTEITPLISVLNNWNRRILYFSLGKLIFNWDTQQKKSQVITTADPRSCPGELICRIKYQVISISLALFSLHSELTLVTLFLIHRQNMHTYTYIHTRDRFRCTRFKILFCTTASFSSFLPYFIRVFGHGKDGVERELCSVVLGQL